MLRCPACKKDRIPDDAPRCPLCAGPLLVDYGLGDELQKVGRARVLANEREEWKARVREVILSLARRMDLLTIEDVRRECSLAGIEDPHHPNCWGAVLRGAGLKPVSRVKNHAPKAHARFVVLWGSPYRPDLGTPVPAVVLPKPPGPLAAEADVPRETICSSCGNDLAADGQKLCLDCLQRERTRPYREAPPTDLFGGADHIDPTQEGRGPDGRRRRP